MELSDEIEDDVEQIFETGKAILSDPVNAIGAIGQNICDVVDEEGIAYSVSYVAADVLIEIALEKGIGKIKELKNAKHVSKVDDVADAAGDLTGVERRVINKVDDAIDSGNFATKIGSTNEAVRSFTREDIINSLDGVTMKSSEIANAIRNKDVGINVLGDGLFESYLGCTSDTVAMQIGDQIYVRSSSASLLSDVVHEGTHAIDYLNGIDERIISSWIGEIKAYSEERLFQIESGMHVQFINEEDMMVHIWSNYSR